jgi:hypothetical protein
MAGGRFDEVLRVRTRDAERPPDLVALERLFGWPSFAPDEFDVRLRPVLARLAVSRLAATGRLDQDADPAAAHDLVPPELVGVVAPHYGPRQPRADLGPEDVARLVDLIERL